MELLPSNDAGLAREGDKNLAPAHSRLARACRFSECAGVSRGDAVPDSGDVSPSHSPKPPKFQRRDARALSHSPTEVGFRDSRRGGAKEGATPPFLSHLFFLSSKEDYNSYLYLLRLFSIILFTPYNHRPIRDDMNLTPSNIYKQ